MKKLKTISQWLNIRRFLVYKKSRFTKEEAKKIAKEHKLKAEFKFAMKHGCSPDEALLILDIYPTRPKTEDKLSNSNGSLFAVIDNLHRDYFENLAINDPDLCYDIIKKRYEDEEYEEYIPRETKHLSIGTQVTSGDILQVQRTNELNTLKEESEKLSKAKDNVFLCDIIALSEELKVLTEKTEIINHLKNWITEYCFGIPVEEMYTTGTKDAYEKIIYLIISNPIRFLNDLQSFVEYKLSNNSERIEEIKSSLAVDDTQETDYAELFVNKCVSARNAHSWAEQSKYKEDAEQILKVQLGCTNSNVLYSYLSNCTEDEIRKFARACLNPEELGKRSKVNIVIKKIDEELLKDKKFKRMKNIGNYLLYTEKEGEDPVLLKFTRQPSAVFYLMYLIDRCNHNNRLDMSGIDLRKNELKFKDLYHEVYNVGCEVVDDCYNNLLRSVNRHGELNGNGRKFLIYDINKHLKEAFMNYDENYQPYVMTADRHLTVDKNRIHFDDSAKDLLKVSFL